MISWNFVSRELRDYNPDQFSFLDYCGAMQAMGIEFVHRPVDDVMRDLENEAYDTVNRIHRMGSHVVTPEKPVMHCLQYCLELQVYPSGMGMSPNAATYAMLRKTCHFIGKCYDFALGIKVKRLIDQKRERPNLRYDTGKTLQKRLVVKIWLQLLFEMSRMPDIEFGDKRWNESTKPVKAHLQELFETINLN